MDTSIIIVGASVRAAAQSARRAGLRPWCADLFADRDLLACADARRVSRYPDDLFAALRDAPPGAWMYTGGLENFPDEIDRFAENRELLGCRGTGLRAVRDPFALHRTLNDAEFGSPECRRFDDPPSQGAWLVKPNRGSGGRGIRRAEGASRECNPATNADGRGAKRSFAALRSQAELGNEKGRFHFQQFVPGRSISAVGVGDGRTGSLLGVTRQLVGGPGAPEFAYCGSVGPIDLASAAHATVSHLIDFLAAAFDLRGLFGVDLILDDADHPWVIEVNPRWPASVEVLELATGLPAMQLHIEACRRSMPTQAWEWHPSRPSTIAKVIHYARADGRFPDIDPSSFIFHPSSLFRDVSHHNEPLHAGMPVITELFTVDDPWSPTLAEDSRRRFDALMRDTMPTMPDPRARPQP